MKTTETKSTHSQQHVAADKSSAEQAQERPFFSESTAEQPAFFQPGGISYIQPKMFSGSRSFFQPSRGPNIQAKCDSCESEEGQQEQSAKTLTLQRMPAFESEADKNIQSKSLLQRQEETEMEPEEEASPDTELQTKLARNAVDPPEDGGESGENRLPFTQAKLTVGKPNDRYEQEADAVANQVVAMPKQGLNLAPKLQTKPLRKNISKLVQRQVVFLQPKRLQGLPKVQKQGDGSLRASSDVASRLHSSRGLGSSLDENTRSEMESAFGADFGDVRVHTGSNAAQLSQDLGAKAFTHGSNIYFNEGQYNPNSSEGKHLLAHELTHTIQQGASIQRKVKISTRGAPTVQLLLGYIKRKIKRGINYLAERTIPGYTLLNVFLGKNLITGEAVTRSGVNLIRGYMRLSPLIGSILLSELEETETLPQAGKWVESKVVEIGIDFNDISRRLKLMWNEVSWRKGKEGNLKVFIKHLGPVIGKILAFSGVVMKKVKELRFEAALRLVGATQLLTALKKDPKAFKKAVDDPKAILKQFMVGALKKGFSQFKDNFIKHFKGALLRWLFGKAGEMKIEMPKKFDVAGIFHLIAQLLGVTKEKIRELVIKRLGPKGEAIVSRLERTVSFIKDLFTQGPVAMWERVQKFLGNFKEMVFSAIATLLTKEIIKAAVVKLLSMLNPAGALVQLALTLYKVVNFFIKNWETIKTIAVGILNSIAKVALNKIDDAAASVEKILAKGMQLIIDFLARIFNLGSVVDKVELAIDKFTAPVRKVRDMVIGWIVKMGRKLFRKGKAAIAKAKEKILQWWKAKVTFKANDGKSHKLFFDGKGKGAKLMIASVPGTFENFIGKVKADSPDKESAKEKALALARQIDKVKNKPENTQAEVEDLLKKLSRQTSKLFGASQDLPKSEISYSTDNALGAIIGNKMVAKVLTKKPPANREKGSKPTRAKHPVFNSLFFRATEQGGSTYYVKGHLLNDNIHGPGKYKNLVPLSKQGNSNHEKQVESKVKAAVQSGAIVKYTVSVSGGFYNTTVPKNETLQNLGIKKVDWGTIKKIREAEKFVPKKLKNEAFRLEFEDEDYTKVKGEKKIVSAEIDNPVDTKLENYNYY